MSLKTVLVTGGTGYIGSHTITKLVEKGYEPIIIDNLCNSSYKVLERLEKITNRKIKFYEGDCTNEEDLDKVFKENKIDAIIHFAALKAVGESCAKPLTYYYNNLISTMQILKKMEEYNVNNLIYSSSATVYGNPVHIPSTEEDASKESTSPYGSTKIFNEKIIMDYASTHKDLGVAILRYFNPIGAHPSGLIGEDPSGIPNNLMPYITQVAIGKRKELSIFGSDYETRDGTCLRDYFHVMDLAEGHILALKKIEESKGAHIYNLGSGNATSVLEMVHAYERATGIKIPYKMAPRRDGDAPVSYASIEKARKELNYNPQYSIEDCCADSNRFQQMNPKGYND